MTRGQQVKVKCPTYKNGRTFFGVVTGWKSAQTVFVLINGNKKSTPFYTGWIIS